MTVQTEQASIDEMLREYADALYAAAIEENSAGPRAETDPEVDRAWERVAQHRTAIGLHIRELEQNAARLDKEWDEEADEHSQALQELTEAQRALVLLANQLERHSVPFVPEAETATAKARAEIRDLDIAIERGMQVASEVIDAARAATTEEGA